MTITLRALKEKTVSPGLLRLGFFLSLALLITALSATFTVNIASADDRPAFKGDGPPPPPHEKNAEFEQAMKECFESVDLDDDGHPDRDAMDECMSEKGFEKPDGPPPGDFHEGNTREEEE